MQGVQQPDTSTLSTKALYEELEAKVIQEGASGKKSAEIKHTIIELAEEIGKTDLLMRALYPLIQRKLGKSVPRANFTRVCEINWEVTTDDDGLNHIDLSRPKTSKKNT